MTPALVGALFWLAVGAGVLLAAGLAVGAVMRAIARQDPEDDGWGGYND